MLTIWVFAAVAAVAGLLTFALAVGRHLAGAWSIAPPASAIGLTRAQIVVGAALPVAFASLVGVAVGSVLAALMSVPFPISIAAAAELYRALLEEIEAHDGDVFGHRAHLPAWEMLRRLPGIYWRSRSVQS